jgi:methyl-accepting chemotaxis protein
VVANEVKELAQETAKATEDIAAGEAIQATPPARWPRSGRSARSSADQRLPDHHRQAVEEQTATTNEMSRSVRRPRRARGRSPTTSPGLGRAESTTQALTQTRTAVDELSRMAADLRSTVAGSPTEREGSAFSGRAAIGPSRSPPVALPGLFRRPRQRGRQIAESTI